MNRFGQPLRRFALLGITAAVLSACGGGGSSDSSTTTPGGGTDTTPTSHSISGSAAAGAPIVGTVTVKDANGTTKQVAIGENGKFTVDVTGLVAPFVFRASGVAAGNQWTIYSAASSADVDGTINVTPLTDLIVANVAGKLAADYFDSGNFSSMSKAQLDAESAKLAERLRPILAAMGVDAATDLLRTPFTPLADPLDKVLDIIQVSYDTTDQSAIVAKLTNIVTAQQITDSLATKAAEEANAATMSTTTNVAAAADDITGIRAALNGYAALFATSVPTAAQIKALVTTSFLSDDLNATRFADEEAGNTGNIGVKFTDIEIENLDYTSVAGQVTAKVNFTSLDKDGVIGSRQRGFRFRRVGNGPWLLHGNRQCVAIELSAHMTKTVDASGAAHLTSGLEFLLEDSFPGNCQTSTPVVYATVEGPGLPQGGLRYVNPELGGYFKIDGTGSTFYPMAGTDGAPDLSDAVNSIPDKAAYKVTLYDGDDNVINWTSGDPAYIVKLPKRPLNLTELTSAETAAKWPVIDSPTREALASYAGGATTVNFSNMNPAVYGWGYIGYWTQQGTVESADGDLQAKNGTASFPATLLAPPQGETIGGRDVRIVTSREGWREYMTRYYLYSSSME